MNGHRAGGPPARVSPPTRRTGGRGRAECGDPLVPRWFRRTVAYCGGLLVVGATVGVLGWIALKLALVTISLITALLLAALLEPLARWLRRALPPWVAAALALLALLAVVAAMAYLLERRIRAEFGNLAASLAAGVDQVRNWLVTGPFSVQPRQVDEVRDRIVAAARAAAPTGVAAASTVISVLTGVAVALFVLFFLLKDGSRLWNGVVTMAPSAHRERAALAGEQAWDTLSRYVRGVVVIAVADALLIGIGLFALGVPLALSLSVLVFLGAFVPLVGATVSGAVAVLVALVARGPLIALVVLGIVLLVQNVEGNILQPLVQSRAVRLHPVVIFVAVTVGLVLFGVGGAVVAVPLVAVVHRVAGVLRSEDPAGSGSPPHESG